MFSYEIMDPGHSVSFGLYYGLKPNSELQILSEVFKDSIGHVNYNADNSGYFTFCLRQAGKQEYPTVRVCSSLPLSSPLTQVLLLAAH